MTVKMDMFEYKEFERVQRQYDKVLKDLKELAPYTPIAGEDDIELQINVEGLKDYLKNLLYM